MNESIHIYSPHGIDVAVDWCMAILLQSLALVVRSNAILHKHKHDSRVFARWLA